MQAIGKSNIIGNIPLCNRLYEDIKSSTLSHAYIIEGKVGSGRHLIAKNIIAALACESDGGELPCLECRSCTNIFEGKCPDVFVIGREGKQSLGIDAVRGIKDTILAVPNDLDFKAYILEDADTMTQQAQNAFLLTLEQPPTRVYFFILCENARSLLETIRSRAPIIRTEHLSDEEISNYICSSKVDRALSDIAKDLKSNRPDEYAALLTEADGSIGKAIELLNPKKLKPINDARVLAVRLIKSLNIGTDNEIPLSLFKAFSQKRDELKGQLEYVKLALRDLILLKKSENAPLCFFFDREDALELSSTIAEKKLISAFDEIQSAQAKLSSNANARLTLTALLSKL